jgi:lysosomal acid lipase/cholesteryl ester hydrolase
MDLVDLHN